MRKILFSFVMCIAAMATTSPAHAAAVIQCSNTDISPTATACSGFVSGNALGGADKKQATAATSLAKLGFTGDLAGIETIENLKGLTLIDFKRILVGTTIIGVHYGNGTGSPGNLLGGKGDGDDTAFYLFDAGSSLNAFSLKYSASSSVRLYQTGVSAVPEPGTWAMMLLGFGLIGGALRSRKKQKFNGQLAF